jgi:hypothetical protein
MLYLHHFPSGHFPRSFPTKFACAFLTTSIRATCRIHFGRPDLQTVKARESNPIIGLDRPLGFQEVEALSSRQSAHECGKVVSPTHWPPLPPRKSYWYSFLLEAESTSGP